MVPSNIHTEAAWIALVLVALYWGGARGRPREGRPPIPEAGVLARLPADGGPEWNRLVFEKSPYLLQHAANPVDWYPWGQEAFERARAEGKPVFVSIGYSTCHWCHVMERESFENAEIAALLNEHFVCIKVDREERPDVDHIYMAAVVAMTGRGGWPLSAFLTPDGEPFFAGTYFPPRDRFGRPGFRTLLGRIADEWRTGRAGLMARAGDLAARVRAGSGNRGGVSLNEEVLERAAAALGDRFDAAYGGFGGGTKFPSPHNLMFLLRHHARSGDDRSLAMVAKTLDAMAAGGMADHLGGGFHRYATDREWLVPHFEKMLYDQAMLAMAYLEGYQATGEERYAGVAREIFRYVRRDMKSSTGAFFAAEDADSDGEEGLFYVWSREEIAAVLGEKEGALFSDVYGVTEGGNFEKGRSILHRVRTLDEEAAARGEEAGGFARRMAADRERLLEKRNGRVRPPRDDKILTAWNGLMISALARGAKVLGEPEHARAAARAAGFLLEKMRTADGRLLRRFRDGEAAIPGYIDDYAFLVNGLVDLYEATFEPRWLEEALSLSESMWDLFWDDRGRGFFFQGDDAEELIARTKESYDGAIPSGSSVAALALLRLGDLTGDPALGRRGRAVIDASSGEIDSAPAAHAQMLSALDFAIGPTVEVVIAGEPGERDVEAMLRAVHGAFVPNKVIALRPEGEAGRRIAALAPFVADQRAAGGKATAYVCRNHACSLPTSDPAAVANLLAEARVASFRAEGPDQ